MEHPERPLLTLPEGWTRTFSPIGHLGADTTLRDEAGTVIGSYGWVGSSRADRPAGHWECCGRRMPSEQACIDELVRRPR